MDHVSAADTALVVEHVHALRIEPLLQPGYLLVLPLCRHLVRRTSHLGKALRIGGFLAIDLVVSLLWGSPPFSTLSSTLLVHWRFASG